MLDAVIDYADQLDADGLALAMDNALEQLCTDSNAPALLAQAESQDRAINAYSWSTLLDQLLEWRLYLKWVAFSRVTGNVGAFDDYLYANLQRLLSDERYIPPYYEV